MMALAEWEHTTDTTITATFQFLKILVANNLLDEAEARLQEKGLDHIRVSVHPIRELQEMVKEHFKKRVEEQGPEM